MMCIMVSVLCSKGEHMLYYDNTYKNNDLLAPLSHFCAFEINPWSKILEYKTRIWINKTYNGCCPLARRHVILVLNATARSHKCDVINHKSRLCTLHMRHLGMQCHCHTCKKKKSSNLSSQLDFTTEVWQRAFILYYVRIKTKQTKKQNFTQTFIKKVILSAKLYVNPVEDFYFFSNTFARWHLHVCSGGSKGHLSCHVLQLDTGQLQATVLPAVGNRGFFIFLACALTKNRGETAKPY